MATKVGAEVDVDGDYSSSIICSDDNDIKHISGTVPKAPIQQSKLFTLILPSIVITIDTATDDRGDMTGHEQLYMPKYVESNTAGI